MVLDRAGRNSGMVIPGIGIEYEGSIERLKGCPAFEEKYRIARLSSTCDRLHADGKDTLHSSEDTLENQKLSYVVNCAMCDLFMGGGFEPDHVIGYSMGLYAALYAGGYCSFETGLKVIELAYEAVSGWCQQQSDGFGMAILLGLTEEELRRLLFEGIEGEVDIAVYNGSRSYVVSGTRPALLKVLERSIRSGAISARLIGTEHPYHHRFLEPSAGEFATALETLEFFRPRFKVLSLLNGRPIGSNEVVSAVSRALCSPLRFDETIRGAVESGVRQYFETGPKKAMSKLMRYIDKRLRVRGLED